MVARNRRSKWIIKPMEFVGYELHGDSFFLYYSIGFELIWNDNSTRIIKIEIIGLEGNFFFFFFFFFFYAAIDLLTLIVSVRACVCADCAGSGHQSPLLVLALLLLICTCNAAAGGAGGAEDDQGQGRVLYLALASKLQFVWLDSTLTSFFGCQQRVNMAWQPKLLVSPLSSILRVHRVYRQVLL